MPELFLKIVNMSISASWLVLAVIVLRFILRKAPKRFRVLLWGLVAFRLICPFTIESAFSLVPSSETIPPQIMMDRTPEIHTGFPVLNAAVNPVITDSFAPAPAASANPLQILIPVASAVWLAGIAALLLYIAVSYFLLKRKVAAAVRLRYNIFQSEYITTPFVLGIFKPRIYLPYTMSKTDMVHVISHEKAHIRRHDHWWKPLGFQLLCVYWFNPVMWIAYKLFCQDIELACDEHVIQSMNNHQRADYAQALLTCSRNRHLVAACPIAFGEVGVKTRIKSVMNYRKPTFWMILCSVAACFVAAVCFLTNPKDANPHAGITYYYGTVTDQAMSVIHEGSRESREYISLHCDNGEEMQFWASEPNTSAPALMGEHVMVRSGIEESSGLRIMTRIAVTDNTWAYTVDEAIENAILDFNWSPRYEGMLQCADFVVLSNEAGSPAATNAIDTVVYYGLALHQVFYVKDGELVEEGGSHIPAVLTFAIDDSGRYILTEYWEPRDGSYYTGDIKEKFPIFVWPDTQKYIAHQKEKNIAKALEYYKLDSSDNAEPQPGENANETDRSDVVSDIAYFMERMPNVTFRDMDTGKKEEILSEYGNLLDGYTMLARESTAGTPAYIVGYYDGNVEDSPLYNLHSFSTDGVNGTIQVLYPEEEFEAVSAAMDRGETPENGYVIQNSTINHSPTTGLFLIDPLDSGWDFHEIFNKYLRPNGREYLLDADSRGIALYTPTSARLEIHLISEQWGEISESIPLTEEQVKQILSEKRQPLRDGTGFSARLYPAPISSYYIDEEEGVFTEFRGVPQTVLDLAVEKCGYRFAAPNDIQSDIVQARLDCEWLEEPIFADVSDLNQLQRILQQAEYKYVGACGYGAKLIIRMEDGTEMVIFKGTDGCDTVVFGSYGGYVIGDTENQLFWDIFGIDIEGVWG